MNFYNDEKQASRNQASTVNSTGNCAAESCRRARVTWGLHVNYPNNSSPKAPAAAALHTQLLLLHLWSVYVHTTVLTEYTILELLQSLFLFYHVGSGDQTACEVWWQVPLPRWP